MKTLKELRKEWSDKAKKENPEAFNAASDVDLYEFFIKYLYRKAEKFEDWIKDLPDNHKRDCNVRNYHNCTCGLYELIPIKDSNFFN